MGLCRVLESKVVLLIFTRNTIMKYSVIIPVYNAERTLRRCLDSFLPQLNRDVEVILVNDGSTDKSALICKEYVEKSPCFRYYEQPNLGVSVARNKGIDKAKGKYIIFIDSDDYVSRDMFTQLNDILFDNDFVISSLIISDDAIEHKSALTPFESKEIGMIILKTADMICRKQINPPIGKIYKRSILNTYNIRFPEGCSIAEDKAFNIVYALHVRSLKVVDDAFYHYSVTTQDSLSRKIRSVDELNDHFHIEQTMVDEALASSDLKIEHIERIREAENFCSCRQVYSRAKRMKLRGANKKTILSGIREDCKEINKNKLRYPKTIYCKKIYLPVKFKQYWLIYMVAMKLAERAS